MRKIIGKENLEVALPLTSETCFKLLKCIIIYWLKTSIDETVILFIKILKNWYHSIDKEINKNLI